MPGALTTTDWYCFAGVYSASTLPSASVSVTVSPADSAVENWYRMEHWVLLSSKPDAIPAEPIAIRVPPLMPAVPA